MTGLSETWNTVQNSAQKLPVIAGMGLLLGILNSLHSLHLAQLLLIGAALGATLQLTAFGFTSAYRRFHLRRQTQGLYAQLLMLALATLLFTPLLAKAEGYVGAIAPASLSVAVGATLFGIGMQLGDGCGSGTLYKAGAGMPRMLLTLVAFCVGSFAASLQMSWWQNLPALPVKSLSELFGHTTGIVIQLCFIGLLATLLLRWRQRQPNNPWRMEPGRLLLAGALLLALLNFATLLTAGHPWTITWGFTLWGAKTAQLLGWDPANSLFWSGSFQREALMAGILEDTTSLMDIGILIGALVASAISGRFKPSFTPPLRTLLAALIGGLLMGYGSRIAYGCNIGAFFSGIASMSLHGWLWIVFALIGSSWGVRARPWFGLSN